MDSTRDAKTVEAIRTGVSAGLALLPPHIRTWAEARLIEPRGIRAALDPHGNTWSEFLLVTDDLGQSDSGYRVVYDPVTRTFGTVTQVENGPLWYLGSDGTFDAAVAKM